MSTLALNTEDLNASGPAAGGVAVPRKSLAALDNLRRRIRRATVWDGATWISVLFVVASIVSFVLDYSLQLPLAVRGFFVVVGVCGAAVVVLRYLVTRLARRVTDEELAMLIEETHPGMRQTLITAVQLHRPESIGGRFVSKELLDSVVAEVEERVATISPARVIRLRRLKRNAIFLVALVATVIGGAVSDPQLAGIWFRRNLLLSAEMWPRSTILELDPGTPFVVAMGDDLTIGVRVLKGSPRSVTVESELEDGSRRANNMELREHASRDIYIEESAYDLDTRAKVAVVVDDFGLLDEKSKESILSGSGLIGRGLGIGDADGFETKLRAAGAILRVEMFDLFVYEFRNVSQAFRFWVEGGDHRLGGYEGYAVEVRLRPRIDMTSIELKYRLPVYTGQSGVEISQYHGNVKVPVGTLVSYRMATSIPVAKCYFVLRSTVDDDESQKDGNIWPDAGAVDRPLEDGRRFSGKFIVESSGYYYFQFEDGSGFRSIQPERFRVQAIQDRKPIVRIVEPSRSSEEVSPLAEVSVRVVVKDDYPVRSVVLDGAYTQADATEPIRKRLVLLESVGGDPADATNEPRLETYLLKIPDLVGPDGQKPRPGAKFEFFVQAEDFGETAQTVTNSDGSTRVRGNIGVSQNRLLHIVDSQYLEEEFTRETMIFRDIASRLIGKQESVRKDLESTQEAFLLKGAINAKDASKLARHRQDQQKVTEGLQSLSKQMGQLLGKMESNKVGEDKWKDWLRGIRDQVTDIGKKKSKDVASRIDAIRRAAQESKRDPSELEPVVRKQREIERDLNAVVTILTEFGDLRGVIQLMREVKRRQEAIRAATKPFVAPGEAGGSSE